MTTSGGGGQAMIQDALAGGYQVRAADLQAALARAERRRTARRLVCRQLARVAGGWSLFGVVAPWMPLVTVLYGLGIIAAGALFTMAAEWWASNALAGLLRAEAGSR